MDSEFSSRPGWRRGCRWGSEHSSQGHPLQSHRNSSRVTRLRPLGYVARPIGGIVFGHFGDQIGRKRMLIIAMALMGTASGARR